MLYTWALTIGLEDCDTGAARAEDGVIAYDTVVTGPVEHDSVIAVVEHIVVLDRHIVAPVIYNRDPEKHKCAREKHQTCQNLLVLEKTQRASRGTV